MKAVSLDFEKPVWRVMPDHAGPGLAIEVRSREDKEVQFFYLNLSTGKKFRIHTENDWWKGLQEVQAGIVLLHGYENPGLPLTRGLYAYDGEAGKLLWEKPQSTFEALAQCIIRSKNQQGLQTYISLSSGVEESNIPNLSVFNRETETKNSNLSFPKIYIEGMEEFSIHQNTIKQQWDLEAQVQIDLLQGEGSMAAYQIFNFYQKNPTGTWNQDLGILTQNKPSFHRQIGTNLKGLSLDPFFIFQEFLIWIENTHQLSYLRLG